MKVPSLPLLALSIAVPSTSAAYQVAFDWFEYTGKEPFYDANPLQEGQFYNPVLPGFYPDPNAVSVDGNHYVVHSSFAYFPGVPIFHSRDLVNWEQIGHVLDRPEQLDLDGHRTSRGIFAPAISYHNGLYYMVTTVVDTAGNFYVTAKDPAGPWSDPILLPEVDGIDPSFFFDDDGRAWLVNNGPPPNDEPLYEGHRAIWIQEFDVESGQLTGPRSIIINGGVDLAEEPVWIEGPHIVKRGGWYYLHCAEGGTSVDHRQVVFRSKNPDGPYEPWDQNPILTQRKLPDDRPNKVSATGHADFIKLGENDWWTVFLATMPYEEDYYSTGRQTFLLPMHWTEDGWPDILPVDQAVPLVLDGPSNMEAPTPRTMGRGNFTKRDDFGGSKLAYDWVMLRTPRGEPWWKLGQPSGVLQVTARSAQLNDRMDQPSFLGRRQQHHHFEATTAMAIPAVQGVEAGLVTYLDETHYFFVGARRTDEGVEVFLEKADGEIETVATKMLCSSVETLQFRSEGAAGTNTLSYSLDGHDWVAFPEQDGRILTIQHSWGFTGVMIGPFARIGAE